MTVVAADRIVFLWAHRNNYDCEFCVVDDTPGPCMLVRLNHATACLQNGRLIQLDTRRDGRFAGDLSAELANLFALCGHLESQRWNANETTPAADASGRRNFHRDGLRPPCAQSAGDGRPRSLRSGCMTHSAALVGTGRRVPHSSRHREKYRLPSQAAGDAKGGGPHSACVVRPPPFAYGEEWGTPGVRPN